MNVVSSGADPRVGAFCKPCAFNRCSASTSGRPFGSPPSQDRHCSGPQRNDSGVLCWPVNARSQRLPKLEAVRGGRQEKTKKSSETPQVLLVLSPAELLFGAQSVLADWVTAAADTSRRAEPCGTVSWIHDQSSKRLVVWGKQVAVEVP